MPSHTTIIMHSLEENKIGDDGAVGLGEGLGKNSSLTSLSLEANKIGLNGEMALAEMLLTENDGLREISGLPDLPSIGWSTLLRTPKGDARMKRIWEYVFDMDQEKWTSAAHELAGKLAHIFAGFLVVLTQYDAKAQETQETQRRLRKPEFWLLKLEDADEKENSLQGEDEDSNLPLIHALFDCHATTTQYSLPRRFCDEVLMKCLPLKDGLSLMKAEDGGGRTVRSLALTNKNTKVWAKTYGTYLDRYSVMEGPPVHESKTCAVHFATDIQTNEAVALKIMREKEQYNREIRARKVAQGSGGPKLAGCLPLLHREDLEFAKRLDKELCLVMERGSRSLFEAINTERFAGRDLRKIRMIAYKILSAVKSLHDSGRIHGDIKPRNVVRVSASKQHTFLNEEKGGRLTVRGKWRENVTGEQSDVTSDEDWQLIDLDASAKMEDLVTEKVSTGYAAPELAKWHFLPEAKRDKTPPADPAIDVWGFGVVLFQMLSGTKLFMVDESDDNLVTRRDKVELINWLALDDERLHRIKSRHEKDEEKEGENDGEMTGGEDSVKTDGLDAKDYEIEAARDLVRLCLRGNAKERITVEQILDEHPFFETLRNTSRESEEGDKIIRGARTSSSSLRFSRRVMSLHKRVIPKRFSLFGRTTEFRQIRNSRSSAFYKERAHNELIELPTYHFFLSHMQSQAAGIVKDLAAGLERHRMSSWVDMNATEINLESMHRGVLSSQCFIMVLTKDVLSRPYCLAELHFAVEYFGPTEDGLAKHIFFVVEEDTRFHPWNDHDVPRHCSSEDSTADDDQSDREGAGNDKASSHNTGLSKLGACQFWSHRRGLQHSGGDKADAVTHASKHETLCDSLDKLELQNWKGDPVNSKQILNNAKTALLECKRIPYRRRLFEEDAMLRVLAERAGFQAIPRPIERIASDEKEDLRLKVVGKQSSKAVKNFALKLGKLGKLVKQRVSVDDANPHVVVVVLEKYCWDDVQAFWESQLKKGEDGEEMGAPLLAVAVCGTKKEWNFNDTDEFEIPALRSRLFDRLEVLMWRDAPGAKNRDPEKYIVEHEEPALMRELYSRAKRLQRSSLTT